ncbi:HAD-IA family hydrolase [Paracoccus kondratievae]|uniref:HAD family hydrolase n=1 Tax=Paracoccus TaxID=265 RepID=UPI000225F0A4|nr:MULTISPECIES: HAD family phosphatase [Paracoccus]QFQ88578.1 HAD-IA family hydrolase [Paracoccus kondratievae]
MRAVLWDLDGTLVDSEPAHELAFDAAIAELGLSVPAEFHDRLLGASEDRVHEALVAQTAITLDRAGWRAVKWRHYRETADRITRLSQADLLAPLANAGRDMALVSNSTRAEVEHNLSVAGLARYFPVTVSRDDVRRGKPDPEGYLLAAERLGVPPADCVVVEDSPTGAAAGLAAGMTTIFCPQIPTLKPPAGALIASPGKLAGLFGRLGLLPQE